MEGRTYRYYHGTPLYPFGYGLSYSRFEYHMMEVTPTTIKVGESVKVTVGLTNHGPYDASEVGWFYMNEL